MARFLITLLGSSKQNCDWHIFTVSILFVRKSLSQTVTVTVVAVAVAADVADMGIHWHI